MNVSKGDLAYIVDSDIPEVIGRIVKVLHWDSADEDWLCESIGAPIPGLCDGEIVHYGNDISCPDCDLRRIAGPSIDTTEKTDEPIKETA